MDITIAWNKRKNGTLPPQNKRQTATLDLWQAWLEEEPSAGYEAMCIEVPDALTELYEAASRSPNEKADLPRTGDVRQPEALPIERQRE